MVRYSKTHEWARIEGNTAVIGISDHAQKELGDVVYVELPSVGDAVETESQYGTVESTKAASELFSPLSGKVIAVNEELAENPQWVNEDPLQKGWMIKIELTDPQSAENLMDEEAYREFLQQQS
ncbi:MAG: glycine cleavage system protein GcvH [Candidatus Omnitrophica bacterium]|nr:glycine cleavage system protein GcvH [Candidatus Omnitrophota bacterium]